MKGITWLVMIKVWICWNFICMVSVEADNDSVMDKKEVVNEYPIEHFTVSSSDDTKNDYLKLINNLRTQLAGGEIHGIPVLGEKNTVQISKRYILIELSYHGEENITLAMDVINVYIVAFRGKNASYFLKESEDDLKVAKDNLFKNTQQIVLPYSGNYQDLEKAAKKDRLDIELGGNPLGHCIKDLYYYDENKVPRCLIVCIQMFSEAVRYPGVMQAVRRCIKDTEDKTGKFKPSSKMIEFETSWDKLSTAVQQSNEGVFDEIVISGQSFTSARKLIPFLAIMLFKCTPSKTAYLGLISDSAPFAATYAPSSLLGGPMARMLSTPSRIADEVCTGKPEPSFLIQGLLDKCVDINNNQYNIDGSPVIMSTCSNQDSHRWTLKTDETIQANKGGKCLTATTSAPGSSVVIFDCAKTESIRKRWKISADGTVSLISDPDLVLTAVTKSSTLIELAVQANAYNGRQSWLFTSTSVSFNTSIIGYQDLCLQGDVNSVNMTTCKVDDDNQKWVIKADGSIGPLKQPTVCLTAKGDKSSDLVNTSSCNAELHSQRWTFASSTTIINTYSKLVIDAKINTANPLVLSSPNQGSLTQQWVLADQFSNS